MSWDYTSYHVKYVKYAICIEWTQKKTHRKRVFNILTVCIFRKLSFFDFKMWKRIFGSEFVFDLRALEVPLCSFRGSLPHVNSQQQIQRQKGWQGSSDNDARAFFIVISSSAFIIIFFMKTLNFSLLHFFRSEPNGVPWVRSNDNHVRPSSA